VRARTLLPELVPPLLSLLAALIISGLIVLALGNNPLPVYNALLLEPFQSVASIGGVLEQLVPLLISGLAVAVAFRSGVFNLGVEGQLYLGAFAAAWVGFTLVGPGVVQILGALVAAAVLGAAYAWIPGVLRAYLGANEIVTTIMLNYVALYLTTYLVTGPFRPANATGSESEAIAAGAHLARFVPGSRAHVGVFLALLLAVGVYVLLYRTTVGYELRMAGANPRFAEYGGVSVRRVIVLSMLISGVLAGLLGGIEILGIHYRFRSNFSPGYGFDGITVALLGRVEPLAIPFAALLFAVLRYGASIVGTETQVDREVVNVLQALVILFVTAEGLWSFVRRRRTARLD
jgi:simple sugar transport system permease protein